MYVQTLLVCLAGFIVAGTSSSVLVKPRTLTPNNTCGRMHAGLQNGFSCPSNSPCCSSSGYCGSGDKYCLTSTGCQSEYSNSTTGSCYAPINGQTTTPDNTCGTTFAGQYGYRCDASNGIRCCSSYGYCGNTTEYCQIVDGCQKGYGFCVPTVHDGPQVS